MVIFDIPERQRTVRTFLRNRLKTLGFKMWQASIWVSPYRLDKKLEDELAQLAEKFFIRLIKTTDINYTKDLENLFIK
jgi:CRISPR-associated endonuclease Cas2